MINYFNPCQLEQEPLNVLLVGAGNMGQKHGHTLYQMANVELIGIFDPAPTSTLDLSDELAKLHICTAENLATQIKQADAAIVACSTRHHFDMARMLIDSGIHCLIEKPVTTNLDQCKALVDMAESRKTKVAVGQIERFNPAFITAHSIFKSHHWDSICFSRFNPSSMRLQGDSVVYDLMIHDIDLAVNMLDLTPDSSLSVNASSLCADKPDYVIATYDAAQGTNIQICCGRLPGPKVRQIEASGPDGVLQVDLLERRFHFKSSKSGLANINGWDVQSKYANHLKLQAESFFEYVTTDDHQLICLLEETPRIMELCQIIDDHSSTLIHNYSNSFNKSLLSVRELLYEAPETQ